MLRASVACLSALAITASASADVVYTYHNGVGTTDHDDLSLDTDPPGGALTIWWANEFTAQAGGEVITSVDVAFSPTGWEIGDAFSVVIYDDVNDNGLPDDLVFLRKVDATIDVLDQPVGHAWDNIVIPNTTVSGRFFVAIIADVTGLTNLRIEQTDGQNRSWIGFSETLVLDPASPVSTLDSGIELVSLYVPSPLYDFVIQAHGTVPEPASLALMGTGLLACLRRCRV